MLLSIVWYDTLDFCNEVMWLLYDLDSNAYINLFHYIYLMRFFFFVQDALDPSFTLLLNACIVHLSLK